MKRDYCLFTSFLNNSTQKLPLCWVNQWLFSLHTALSNGSCMLFAYLFITKSTIIIIVHSFSSLQTLVGLISSFCSRFWV